MVTPQRALTGVLGPKMAHTGRQGLHGIAKLFMLIHWVGSPDLGIVHLFPLGCSAPNAKSDQGNGHFRFLARGSKFSKGALRAVGAMACVAAGGGTYHECRRRCTSAVQVKLRCAEQAFLICCKHSSSAASSPAVQLEQPQASTRESQQESRGSRSFAGEQHCVAGCSSVWNSAFPLTFIKGK